MEHRMSWTASGAEHGRDNLATTSIEVGGWSIAMRYAGAMNMRVEDGKGETVASVPRRKNKDSPDIARLIAAAPELLHALRICAATIELDTGDGAQEQVAWPRNNKGHIDYEAIAIMARAAIAKATTV